MNFLKQIIEKKKKELERQKKTLSLDALKKKTNATKRKPRSFAAALRKATPIACIAEIKLSSPGGGRLTNRSHEELAKLYAKSKADAISVVTNSNFGGNISFIKDIKEIAPQPLLRMDFIIDQYQIYETAYAGGDAFLLLASTLTPKKLKEYIILGKKLGMGQLVETTTEKEIESALEAGADIIGINNRSLKTLRVDIRRTEELMQYIPSSKFVISESGISTPQQVEDLVAVGVRGVLVGTSIITAKNPIQKIAELKHIQIV